MFESVLNPLAWWGMLAVGVPIAIHLINRLRYKRIHWAAMEFLLKAMQRNKRKLLLEQLLLLLLRCLIVALIVLLVLRPTWFLGENAGGGSSQFHLVLLDDSLSMKDRDDPNNPQTSDPFEKARKQIIDLAQLHSTSAGSYYWSVLTYSTPELPELGTAPSSANDVPVPRMTSEMVENLKSRIETLKPKDYGLPPLPVLKEAIKHLERSKEGRKFLHIYSDFRRVDWSQGNQELLGTLGDLAKTARVKVKLHDVASPDRTSQVTDVPTAHANLSLSQLVIKPRRTAETVAAFRSDLPLKSVTPRKPFDVHVMLKNWSDTEKRNIKLTASVDRAERSNRIVDRLAAGEERLVIFNLEFGPDETPGLKSILISTDTDHLNPDDAAYGFIVLEKEVPVLIVDSDARLNDTVTDTLFLNAALTGSVRTGIKVDSITPRDLTKKGDLARYPVIYVANVAGVGRGEGDLEEEGLKRLEAYVRGGGSVVIFLGPRTNVASWNEKIYKGGKGIFPAPLMLKPDPDGRKSTAYIDEQPDEMDISNKLRFLRPHPAFPFTGDIAELLTKYIHVNRYFRIDPQWKPVEGSNSVLVQLANRRPLVLYRDEAQTIQSELRAAASGNAKVIEYATKISEAILDAETRKARKGDLLEAIAGVLGDSQLSEFWKDKKLAAVKERVEKFLTVLNAGDALVLESVVNGSSRSGHVLTFLTSAAPSPIRGVNYPWNDMAIGDLGQFFYVPMVLGLQDHMTSLSQGNSSDTSALFSKQPLEMRLDTERYNPQVELWFQGLDNKPVRVDVVTGEKVKGAETADAKDSGEWLVKIKPPTPGHYRLRFNQLQGGVTGTTKDDPALKIDTSKVPEERALSVNIDARTEGNLERLSESQLREALADGLSQVTKLSPVEAKDFAASRNWFTASSGDAVETEQTSSWSDYSWMLLLFLGLLLTEQYFSYKFSHHT